MSSVLGNRLILCVCVLARVATAHLCLIGLDPDHCPVNSVTISAGTELIFFTVSAVCFGFRRIMELWNC